MEALRLRRQEAYPSIKWTQDKSGLAKHISVVVCVFKITEKLPGVLICVAMQRWSSSNEIGAPVEKTGRLVKVQCGEGAVRSISIPI